MDIMEKKEIDLSNSGEAENAVEKNRKSLPAKTVLAVIGIIFLASFFGAVFGFMAGGMANIFDSGSFLGKLKNSN